MALLINDLMAFRVPFSLGYLFFFRVDVINDKKNYVLLDVLLYVSDVLLEQHLLLTTFLTEHIYKVSHYTFLL